MPRSEIAAAIAFLAFLASAGALYAYAPVLDRVVIEARGEGV